ncbi:glycoside hydrolase family 31 protein [Spirillospora sp. CA-294931]|uniref:glycoside hydrolase family 31 protein n=1 Tax=Spirillospora sp. CA-294931 TaxID=3240042 RepID=UPI003D92282C
MPVPHSLSRALAALVLLGPVAAVATASPASGEAPGLRQDDRTITLKHRDYELRIAKEPFAITTRRAGRTVLATAASGALDFTGPSGRATATRVTRTSWTGGVLTLTVATTDPSAALRVTITPGSDRYRLDSTVEGVKATATGVHYDLKSGGHWYGHGEAKSDAEGEPATLQPWPLDAAKGNQQVNDEKFGPASYLMLEPFWFTKTAAGVYVDTKNLMRVSLGRRNAGVADLDVTDTGSLRTTVFVEKNARRVYEDYVGIAGKPEKSDATPEQYATPLWNTWAQYYSTIDQKNFLDYARRIKASKIPGHTMSLDDGWMKHYGDFEWNTTKYPDPKAMSDEIHKMGYKFGLWVTQWINLDADNYELAKRKGYLLKSKDDPNTPCTVTWWNGKAGLIDLGNPAAYKWYEDHLHALEKDYGVDGFKFDTRFFDERCAPASGLDAADYRRLGAELADGFDQQGIGIRVHWTGAQKYGFVTRQVDKGTDWSSLRASVTQNLAISTVGYPFVETDMIGGSSSMPPPTKEVLVRWAQSAAAMPLVYSSTAPDKVWDFVNKKWVVYPPEVAELYGKAMRLHQALNPYIQDQVKRAVASNEPIMKPLFFNFPKDEAAYTVSDEWLLGDSLLAAPVLTEGTSRDVHLPPGTWYDVARGKVVNGGDLRGYQADLGTLPLFVKMGTPDTKRLIAAIQSAR